MILIIRFVVNNKHKNKEMIGVKEINLWYLINVRLIFVKIVVKAK